MTPEKPDKSGIGQHLRALRKARGLSLTEVGRRMGTGHTQPYQIKTGKKDPRMSTVVRYCRAIGAHIQIRLEET